MVPTCVEKQGASIQSSNSRKKKLALRLSSHIPHFQHQGESMFVKIDKKTHEETIISSTDMTLVLERDIKDNQVDDTLTEMVISGYEHKDKTAIYRYKK